MLNSNFKILDKRSPTEKLLDIERNKSKALTIQLGRANDTMTKLRTDMEVVLKKNHADMEKMRDDYEDQIRLLKQMIASMNDVGTISTLEKQVEILKSHLAELKRHLVYGIWTAQGVLLYVGQSTMKGFNRLRIHLLAMGDELNETLPFYHKMRQELKKGEGFYAGVICENLTELEANDMENCLVSRVLGEGPSIGGNVSKGRFTEWFVNLSLTERQVQVELFYETANKAFKLYSSDTSALITEQTIKEILKEQFKNERGISGICGCDRRANLYGGKCSMCCDFVYKGPCQRKNCSKNYGVINSHGFCPSCSTTARKYGNDPKLVPPYDPINAKDKDNLTEKALVYTMYKDEVNREDIGQAIQEIIGKKVNPKNIRNWYYGNGSSSKNYFDCRDFSLALFMSDRKTSDLSKVEYSDGLIKALVAYEHSKGLQSHEAVSRINELFGTGTVEQLDVELIYSELEHDNGLDYEEEMEYDRES